MTETQKLLQEIKAFCKAFGISPTTFGQYAVTNSRLVERLESGGSVHIPQAERARAYMKASREAGALARPARVAKKARRAG